MIYVRLLFPANGRCTSLEVPIKVAVPRDGAGMWDMYEATKLENTPDLRTPLPLFTPHDGLGTVVVCRGLLWASEISGALCG